MTKLTCISYHISISPPKSTYLTFTCPKQTIETQTKGVKFVQS